MGREFALRQAKDHIGILKEAAAMLKAENAALKDEIRRHEEVFQFSANKIAALKQLCAEAYQVVGALNGPVNLLDNLSAGAQGKPIPHITALPYFTTEEQE